MLILSKTQVQFRKVIRKNIFEQVALQGIDYRGRLFFGLSKYKAEQLEIAKKEALNLFNEHQEQLLVIILQSENKLTLWLEDPELKGCDIKQSNSQRIKQINLVEISQEIHAPGGIEFKDRRRGLRRKKYCFLAKDMTKWFCEHYGFMAEDCTRLAQRMMDEKVIYSLQGKVKFESNDDFYRFYDDEI